VQIQRLGALIKKINKKTGDKTPYIYVFFSRENGQ
jgi:hypothetical protein